MPGLRELWGDVIPDAGPLADKLVRRYAGKRRAYRDDYLRHVLAALDSLEQLATDPVAVRLAAWFHRAVHSEENTAREDAEASAQLAEELLPTYGVTEVRASEVARLVRLTGGDAGDGANADVLLDAVDAVLADPQYAKHTSEVRRDSRFDVGVRREQIQALLASERLYRTDLAHDRYEQAARANLTAEFDLLDGLTPHAWRGWQHAGLTALAVLTAFVGFVAAFASIGQPWRYPAFRDDPHWQPILVTVLAAASVAGLWWAARRSDRVARLIPAVPVAIGVIGVVVILLNIPPSNGGSGAGQRVPLLMITCFLLVLAGVAAFVAGRFPRGTSTNRGQLLAGLGAVVVVVLVTLFVLDPIQRAYLYSADEYLDNRHVPADVDVASVVDGRTLWSAPGGAYTVRSLVGTAHGIAVANGRGTVEMIDPKTGKTRWRYTRADTDREAKLYPVDGGQRLLAMFDQVGYAVLDTDTGKRTAAWPDGSRDDEIEDNDPLVTSKQYTVGSDKVYGTDLDGSHRWTYEPGRCTSTVATAVADIAILDVGTSCRQEPAHLIGLDLESGKQRWRTDGDLSDLTAAGDLLVGIRTESEGKVRRLVAIDAHTGAGKWTVDLPKEWACPPQLMWSGKRLVVTSCPNLAKRDSETVVRFVDPGNGQATSTALVAVPVGSRIAVTTDSRVFMMSPEGETKCRIMKLTEGTAPTYVPLDGVGCGWGVAAAGNLVLVSTRDSLVALR
ncbi:PQQ-binding-like beta-propeller repeat protein [Kribbella sp. NPDC051137]|uniref:outer membrane protein assembly factor BamB family protein n=1 Tax=Kribbella sp. NPDC051137 TaxID=3155045 RepID=UPI002F570514